MKTQKRVVIIIYLLAFILLNVGCTKSELYPKADVQLTAESPNIIPTSTVVTDIEESTINVTLLTGVSCSVVGYDLTYETVLGESIESLSIYNIKAELNIAAEVTDNSASAVEKTMVVRPYTQGVMNLLQNSTASISPIRATVNVHFTDVNDNEFSKEVHFLCWKYESSSE